MTAQHAVSSHFRPISAERNQDIADHLCQMQYETSDRGAVTRARLQSHGVGSVGLVHYESLAVEHGVRTQRHIHANPADNFLLCLPLQARFRFSQGNRVADIVRGSALLLSSQRPFDGYVAGESPLSHHASIHVRIPGPLLRSSVPQVDEFYNRSFSVASGAGLILEAALRATLQGASSLSARQAFRQGQVITDLIANCIERFDEEPAPDASPAAALFERATAFIEAQLSDPELDVGLVAGHCGISVRYLHKLFAQHSLSLASHVRETRLLRCRDALRDTRLAHRSVIDIAGDWGFGSPSHFGSIYKERFGTSPSRDRGQTS